MTSTTQTSTKRRQRGFTLIEMMVTIAIIIVSVGLFTGSMVEFLKDRQLEGAGTSLVTKLNEARQEAVAKRTTHVVGFYRNSVSIFREGKEGLEPIPGGLVYFRDPEDPKVTYEVRFAEVAGDDLPDPPPPGEGPRPDDVILRFQRDGSIDFGAYDDVRPTLYEGNVDSDVLFALIASDRRGFVDIRPQGTINFKVDDLRSEEE